MLPSPRLIILVMAAAPLFLAGSLYEGAAALGVLYVIVLALYTSLDALLLPRRRHISVTREIAARVSVGYATVLRFTVENHTRRRIQVQLAQDSPEEIDISPAQCDAILRGQVRTTRRTRPLSLDSIRTLGGSLKRSLGMAPPGNGNPLAASGQPSPRPEALRLPPAESRPLTCALGPGQTAELECRLTAHQRGKHKLGRVFVRVLPAAGLLYRQFTLDLPAEIQVFPNLMNIRKTELLARRGCSHEQGFARLRHIGHGYEFESLRRYVRGDEMARIEWKVTARRADLIVKNFQPERQQSVLVALDVGRATAGEFQGLSRVDYLVNATLMLAFIALRQRDQFSLVAFSDRIESYLPPVTGVKNLEQVARALFQVQPRLVESDYDGACRFLGLRNRKRSLLCVMTDVIDRQASDVLLGYLARFARYHLPLAVTLSNPELQQAAHQPLASCADVHAKAVALDVLAAREEALLSMRRKGVSVLDVPPSRLTAELINRYTAIKMRRQL